MASVEEQKALPPVVPAKFGLNDLLSRENADRYSGFGKMALSEVPTEPKYGFGKATRQAQQKVYQSKQLIKNQFLGKLGADAQYKVTDKYKFDVAPAWSTNPGSVRNTLDIKPKYAYYTRKGDAAEKQMDVHNADLKRRSRPASATFGNAKRFVMGPSSLKTPGPIYNPPFDPKRPQSSKYSFGFRRDLPGQSPLVAMVGTNELVSPANYNIKNRAIRTSRNPKPPAHAVPKELRFRLNSAGAASETETYEDYHATGQQLRSLKVHEPRVPIGKAKRDYHTGMFPSQMATQPVKIRLPHPQL